MWTLVFTNRMSGHWEAAAANAARVAASPTAGSRSTVKVEHRVLGVHGHDRVQVVLGPGGPVAHGQLLDLDAHQLPS